MTPIQALERYFHSDHFLPKQEEIITGILTQKDTLVILPTGGGKSLCYQLPGLIFQGTTIVVTPLIALMKDQVDSLARRNISAGCLHSGMSPQEQALNFTTFTKNGW